MRKVLFFGLFSGILTSLLIYFLYATELHDRLEYLLFDLRSVLKPQIVKNSMVATVEISDQELSYFTTEESQNLPMYAVLEILEAVKASSPRAVAFLLPHQDFNYESEELLPLVHFIRKHKNVYLGIFDYHHLEPSKLKLPQVLQPIALRVAGAGTLRPYRQGVIRKAPLMSYLGEELVPQLSTLLSRRYGPPHIYDYREDTIHAELDDYRERLRGTQNNYEGTPPPGVLINYWKKESFSNVSAKDLVIHKKSEELKDKIVLIGYTAFRRKDINFQEGTLVNTPWEGENNSEVHGSSLLSVTASILENLVSGTWIVKAKLPYIILQTLVYSVLSFAIWMMSPAFAVFLFVLAFTLLFYLHAFLMSYFNTLIPLADTLFFSIIAAIAGAFWKTQQDDRIRALRESKMQTQDRLALVQGRFLNRFAFELFDMNERIEKILRPHMTAFAHKETLYRTFQKAVLSSSELKDYLSGIKHYSLLNQRKHEEIWKKRVFLKTLISRILNQFEALIQEKSILIFIDQEGCDELWTDEILLEPILFNLISNAIKYSPKGSKIFIRTKKYKRKFLSIDVQDYGKGIPKDVHERIFEKFYRVPDDDSHRVKGNGLGLYLVQYFCERIDVKLRFWSELGKGSKFTLIVEKYRNKES